MSNQNGGEKTTTNQKGRERKTRFTTDACIYESGQGQ